MARLVSTVDRICEELNREPAGSDLTDTVKNVIAREAVWAGEADRRRCVLMGILLAFVSDSTSAHAEPVSAIYRARGYEMIEVLEWAALRLVETVANRGVGN